jgi:SpoVK/Ycf46/Vps4 family AAA+-type ATPase
LKQKTCKQDGEKHYKLTMKVRQAVVQELSMQRSMPHFGNARAVDSMLSEAKKRATVRQRDTKTSFSSNRGGGAEIMLTLEDFNILDKGDPYVELETWGGDMMKDILKHFRNIEKSIRMAEKRNTPQPTAGHYIFKGNAGTGKTTVAKYMAAILYRLGTKPRLLPTDRCLIVMAPSLVGTYIGQAQDIVRSQFEAALGGVLVIDEAYQLSKSVYGIEALTTIVALLTHDDFKGKLVCVMAGYAKDMDKLLSMNQGARSRFEHTLMFHDWKPQDCVDLCVKRALKEYKIELDVNDTEMNKALLVSS